MKGQLISGQLIYVDTDENVICIWDYQNEEEVSYLMDQSTHIDTSTIGSIIGKDVEGVVVNDKIIRIGATKYV